VTLPPVEEALDAFQTHRRLLFSVVYDIVGSVADAEDVLQETWLRWSAVDPDTIENPRAYLVRIATRQALNRLRSLRNRRESYVGPWLPEPLVTDVDGVPDPAAAAEQADEVSLAMLVVLETLSPPERAVFVLHDVFGLPHDEVADALGRSSASVRQLAHRAREHVQARRPRFPTDDLEQRRLTEAFVAACADGDLDTLTRMLAPDVRVVSDGGGKAKAARREISGADKVSRFMLGITKEGMATPGHSLRFVRVNGEWGLVGYVGSEPTYLGLLDVRDGQIEAVYIVANPDKLTRIAPLTESGAAGPA
jgi:RNA polymerase sigma-70 factor, ECF subfamily